MSTVEQDAVVGSLIRQRKELQQERAAVEIALSGFSRKLADLSAKVAEDKYRALGALKEFDPARLTALLDDFIRVDAAAAKCSQDLAAFDI
ncbi:MAG TPA: hypothetical protein VHC90_03125 [Bryobacteraceae bacterium]|nr:hypothetical protein [Bryobacteraceae bacterium]